MFVLLTNLKSFVMKQKSLCGFALQTVELNAFAQLSCVLMDAVVRNREGKFTVCVIVSSFWLGQSCCYVARDWFDLPEQKPKVISVKNLVRLIVAVYQLSSFVQ